MLSTSYGIIASTKRHRLYTHCVPFFLSQQGQNGKKINVNITDSGGFSQVTS